MSGQTSPLATPFPALPPIAGVRVAVTRAGYKAWERTDLTYAAFEPGTEITIEVDRRDPVKALIRWSSGDEAGGVFLEAIAL